GLWEGPVERGARVAHDRHHLGRGLAVGPLGCALRRLFAPPPHPCPMRSDLPRGNAQRPCEGVPPDIELARAREEPQQGLLSGVVRFGRRQTPPRKPADERPKAAVQRVKRRAVAFGESSQLLLQRGALARVHARARNTTSDRTWRSSSTPRCLSGRRSFFPSRPPPVRCRPTGPLPPITPSTTSACPSPFCEARRRFALASPEIGAGRRGCDSPTAELTFRSEQALLLSGCRGGHGDDERANGADPPPRPLPRS